MGRVFEKENAKCLPFMPRWLRRLPVSEEIAIAVKAGGPDPHYNPKLRQVIQNAKD
ncbi:MAG: hypothetical protein R2847_09390 [Bacteroidia bacterium]